MVSVEKVIKINWRGVEGRLFQIKKFFIHSLNYGVLAVQNLCLRYQTIDILKTIRTNYGAS